MAKVDGKETKQFKSALAAEGKYDLGEDATAPYDEQLKTVSQFIIDNQGFGDIELNDEGKTDGITGATVTVKAWVELFEKAEKK